MELALAWRGNPQNARRLCIALIIVCLLILIPTVVVVASGLGIDGSEKLIQRDGSTGSEILIGRGSPSWFYIGTGGVHFNPESPPFQIISLYPLVLVAMSILVILGLIVRRITFETLIIVAIFIYILIAMLTGIQLNITDLLR